MSKIYLLCTAFIITTPLFTMDEWSDHCGGMTSCKVENNKLNVMRRKYNEQYDTSKTTRYPIDEKNYTEIRAGGEHDYSKNGTLAYIIVGYNAVAYVDSRNRTDKNPLTIYAAAHSRILDYGHSAKIIDFDSFGSEYIADSEYLNNPRQFHFKRTLLWLGIAVASLAVICTASRSLDSGVVKKHVTI